MCVLQKEMNECANIGTGPASLCGPHWLKSILLRNRFSAFVLPYKSQARELTVLVHSSRIWKWKQIGDEERQ